MCRWGSSFSSKYFLEKRFVVKHILNKHQDKLDEHKEVIRADLYWERYEAAKLLEREGKLRKQRADAAAAAGSQGGLGEDVADWQVGGGGVLVVCRWFVGGVCQCTTSDCVVNVVLVSRLSSFKGLWRLIGCSQEVDGRQTLCCAAGHAHHKYSRCLASMLSAVLFCFCCHFCCCCCNACALYQSMPINAGWW